jgi:indole-3-glycerol phosphate synthase
MPTKLDEIIAATRRRVEKAKSGQDKRAIEERARAHRPRGLRAALVESSGSGAAVIAELKKASPSRGVIRESLPVAQLATELEAAGAAALSVLTEPDFFQGSLSNLAEASRATSLPCLCKDFVLDPFQIVQARAHGADAVLLIAAALSRPEMLNLYRTARELELDALCEVHNESELESALEAGCDLIGVNSRDLRTFQVDRGNLLRLAEKLPKDAVRVAESGISSVAEMRELAAAGYQAFLIGESLMRAQSPGTALRELISAFNHTTVAP